MSMHATSSSAPGGPGAMAERRQPLLQLSAKESAMARFMQKAVAAARDGNAAGDHSYMDTDTSMTSPDTGTELLEPSSSGESAPQDPAMARFMQQATAAARNAGAAGPRDGYSSKRKKTSSSSRLCMLLVGIALGALLAYLISSGAFGSSSGNGSSPGPHPGPGSDDEPIEPDGTDGPWSVKF